MKKIFKIVFSILFLGLLIGANYGAYNLPDWKIDLSSNKVNSLSNFSKKTINEVDGQIEVRVYASDNLPGEVRPIFASLKAILKSMENVNRSKFKLTIVDPLKNEQAKTEVGKYNIQELQFSSIKSDKFEIQKGYFGLVMIYKDKSEVLPVAGDVGNLEYLLISGIKRLSTTNLPTIALSEDSSSPAQSQIQYLRKFLERSYKVVDVELDGDKPIDETAKGLLIVGRTKKVDEKGLIKLKKWADSGKPMVIFLDKVEVNQSMTARKLEETGLEKFLSEQGMKIGDGLVKSSNGAVASFKTPSGNFLVRYPFWLQIPTDQIDKTNPTLSGINMLLLPWASPIEVSGEAKALLWSDNQAKIDDSLSDISPSANKETAGEGEKQVLAAIRNDKVKIALVADKDMVTDQFVVNSQQNLAMALNLVDYMTGDSGLFEIRNKVMPTSTIKPVDEKMRMFIKYGNMIFPILLLGVVYLLTGRYRSSRLN